MTRRFDLHVHSYHSKDACNPPEELVAAAVKQGLSGIAITDHDSCEAHRHHIQAPEGFLVVPGVEVSTAEGHLLCIGATLPRMKGQPAKVVVQAIHAAGGIAIPAHPFDTLRAGIRPAVLDTLDIAALEVFNAAVTSPKHNDLALDYASRRGLSMTASSDAHHASAVGTATTSFDLEELSLPALLAAIRAGGTPEGRYLTFRESMKKHFGNWFRIFNKRPKPPLADSSNATIVTKS
jgi:predicted metal-dependent phosphoesterase TrpH